MIGQTQEEATFIDQLAREQDPNENQEYWIGLYRNEKGTLGESLQPDSIRCKHKGIHTKLPSFYHSLIVLDKIIFQHSSQLLADVSISQLLHKVSMHFPLMSSLV